MPFSIPPIKRVYSLPLYGEQAFWNTFFNYPYQEGVLSRQSYEEQAFWDAFFYSPYQEVGLRHFMRNRHFGIRFSIPPIKGLYSLAIYLGTVIFEYLFQLSLSRGCTLALYEEQAFWDTFFNSPYQAGVLFGIIWGTGILEYHFQFRLSSRCTLALYEEQAFWITFFNSPYQEGVLSGIHMRNKHFGMPFSINPIKKVYCLAFI